MANQFNRPKLDRLAVDYKAALDAYAAADEARKAARDAVLAYMTTYKVGAYPVKALGQYIVARTSSRVTVSYKSLAAVNPELAETLKRVSNFPEIRFTKNAPRA